MIYDGLRSIFFGDQNVYKEDLNNIEYTKLKTIRDSLAACISQAGVAISSLSETALKVSGSTVNPGIAIDKYRRLIYVPSDTSASGSTADDPYYHPAWPSRTASGSGDYVNIYYDVQYDISEDDDTGTSHYTRAYDSYTILIEGSPPSDESGGICLASGGVDCRPLLLPRGVTEATLTEDELWLGVRTDGTLLWRGGGDEVKRTTAQIAYKYLGGAYLNILFSVNVSGLSSYSAYFYVKLYNSLTEVLVDSDYLAFASGDSGYYTISIPVSSLSMDSLYYIELSYMAPGVNLSIRIDNVSIYVT